ncbi:MAG TPA: PEGA domain-containing protein [Nannocystaceae bacterium]|nr:PEGA domain-containing protein [Nannocystaceae bacterium]
MSGIRRFAWFVLLALLFAPLRLHAAPTKVAVIDSQIDGELDDHRRDALVERLVAALRDSGLATTRVLLTCTDAGCRSALAKADGFDRVVVLHVSVERRDWVVEIEVYGADGKLLLSARESCPVCGFGEVEALVSSQAAALRGRLDALTLEAPLLVVTSDPPHARVWVDGNEVGTAPLELTVTTGPHRVRASLPGYVTAERVVDGAAGLRTHASMRLVETPASRRAVRLRAAGWSLFGVGAAALVVGPTLIGVHHRDDTTRCSGDRIDADGDCAFRLTTRAPGIAVTVVGAALVTAGLVLALHPRLGRRVALAPSRGLVLRF